jgi:hypothetical protein
VIDMGRGTGSHSGLPIARTIVQIGPSVIDPVRVEFSEAYLDKSWRLTIGTQLGPVE